MKFYSVPRGVFGAFVIFCSVQCITADAIAVVGCKLGCETVCAAESACNTSLSESQANYGQCSTDLATITDANNTCETD